MKKFYVSALALMIGAIGFAQSNKSTVTQEGINAVSEVTQTGDGLNEAIQYQRNQEGLVKIIQNGSGNYAKQDQSPWYQGAPTGISSPDRGKGNQAEIKQIGNKNEAWQTQRWDNENAYVTQMGKRNWSKQNQNGAQNDASVYQDGEDNTATQTQYGRRVEAMIRQVGNNNTATQTQKSTNNGAVQDEYASSEQVGNNNTSTQTQQGRGIGTGANRNMVKVLQKGDNNTATQNQSNPNSADSDTRQQNVAEIYQFGFRDVAKQDQFGSDGFQKITQTNGRDNYGYQKQYDTASEGMATLTQNGSYNESWQFQWGDKNTSNVNQIGNSNWSKVTQKGEGNTNTVIQTH